MSDIPQFIIRMGSRAFNLRMLATSQPDLLLRKLVRLNSDLNILYEHLYERYNSLTTNEIKLILPKLTILISTIKELLKALHAIKTHSARPILLNLQSNYSALYEIKEDLQNFKIENPGLKDLQNILRSIPASVMIPHIQ